VARALLGCDSAESLDGPEAAGSNSAGNASGGSSGSAGASGGSAGTSGEGTFELLFRDDFDSLDRTRWQLMTHSWDTNLALFSDETVEVKNGELTIRLLPAPEGAVDSAGAAKRFLGAEVRSRDTLTYGRVRARAKLARGSAVVSSLVTIYTPWPADDWNELDIECLGAAPDKVQFNAMVYTGPPTTPPVTQSVTPTQDPYMETLGFDASADYHVYEIEWTPAGAKFSIDGELRYTWTRHIALMKRAQNVLVTIWASSSAAWAGAVTDETATAFASYDWIELYRHAAP
jgi:endo-1,3-1,4-beta-glycanase ExoK